VEFIEFFKTFGFPAGLLIVMSIAIWKVGGRIIDSVIVPVADRHISFMDAVTKTHKDLSNAIVSISQTFEKMQGNHEEIMGKLDEIQEETRVSALKFSDNGTEGHINKKKSVNEEQ
jgi:hypothetical protein